MLSVDGAWRDMSSPVNILFMCLQFCCWPRRMCYDRLLRSSKQPRSCRKLYWILDCTMYIELPTAQCISNFSAMYIEFSITQCTPISRSRNVYRIIDRAMDIDFPFTQCISNSRSRNVHRVPDNASNAATTCAHTICHPYVSINTIIRQTRSESSYCAGEQECLVHHMGSRLPRRIKHTWESFIVVVVWWLFSITFVQVLDTP